MGKNACILTRWELSLSIFRSNHKRFVLEQLYTHPPPVCGCRSIALSEQVQRVFCDSLPIGVLRQSMKIVTHINTII